jgi:hypothetical protein
MLLVLRIMETSETLQQTNQIRQRSKREEQPEILSMDTTIVPWIAKIRVICTRHEINVGDAEY